MVTNELRAYWAEGIGSPSPYSFHPELLAKAEQRSETFARLVKNPYPASHEGGSGRRQGGSCFEEARETRHAGPL